MKRHFMCVPFITTTYTTHSLSSGFCRWQNRGPARCINSPSYPWVGRAGFGPHGLWSNSYSIILLLPSLVSERGPPGPTTLASVGPLANHVHRTDWDFCNRSVPIISLGSFWSISTCGDHPFCEPFTRLNLETIEVIMTWKLFPKKKTNDLISS